MRFKFLTPAFILIELAIILLISLWFVSPGNQISYSSVIGNRYLSNDRLINSLGIKKGDSLSRLSFHTARVERKAINNNVQLKSVKFKIHGSRVKVRVKEIRPLAYAYCDKKYYAIVNNGEVSRIVKPRDSKIPMIKGFNLSLLKSMAQKYYKYSPEVRRDIVSIRLSPTKLDPNRIEFIMKDGNLVVAKLESSALKIKYYPAIAKAMKKRGVVNLELGAYSHPFK